MGVVLDIVPNHQGIPQRSWHNPGWHQLLREGPASPAARTYDVAWSAGGGRIVLPVLEESLAQALHQGLLRVGPDETGEPALLYCPAPQEHSRTAGAAAPQQWSFPLAAGTHELTLEQVVQAQHYLLRSWRFAGAHPQAPTPEQDSEPLPNYRRFFTISTLIGVRVQDPVVYAATVEPALDLVPGDLLTGVRVDHIDGLADPEQFLQRLEHSLGLRAQALGVAPAWVVVEKILCGTERLPSDWPCAGTTGYDVLAQIERVLTHPSGARALERDYHLRTGAPLRFAQVAQAGKRAAAQAFTPEAEHLLSQLRQVNAQCGGQNWPELTSLQAVLRADPVRLRQAALAALTQLGVYRHYPRTAPEDAISEPTGATPDCRNQLTPQPRTTHQASTPVAESSGCPTLSQWAARWAQTTGPVMAKGVEDCAFYRWMPHPWTNEVGADPGHPAQSPRSWWRWAQHLHQHSPATMSTLSTHDTKRSEDVRARLQVSAQMPRLWAKVVDRCEHYASQLRGFDQLGPATPMLLWHTLLALWPVDTRSAQNLAGADSAPVTASLSDDLCQRVSAYVTKAEREAAAHTSWSQPNLAYEHTRDRWVQAVLREPGGAAIRRELARLAGQIHQPGLSNSLSQKLLHLLGPGIPDVYQGAEVFTDSLVDPDNRRPVDFVLLARLLDSPVPATAYHDPNTAKLHLVRTALHLRRDHRALFAPDSLLSPLSTSCPHALAWMRTAGEGSNGTRVIAVATRLPLTLARRGGWQAHTLTLPLTTTTQGALPDGARPETQQGEHTPPEGETWLDLLTGRTHTVTSDHRLPLARVLERWPVAILIN